MATKTSSGDSLEALKPLVGAWRLVATFKDMPPADIGARATFAWLPGERFLIQRWEVPMPEAPCLKSRRVFQTRSTKDQVLCTRYACCWYTRLSCAQRPRKTFAQDAVRQIGSLAHRVSLFHQAV
jgi:hypothetical protein